MEITKKQLVGMSIYKNYLYKTNIQHLFGYMADWGFDFDIYFLDG